MNGRRISDGDLLFLLDRQAEGFSYEQIASELHRRRGVRMTRSAVGGLLFRIRRDCDAAEADPPVGDGSMPYRCWEAGLKAQGLRSVHD